MISAQKERIDGLFLEQKTWPAGVWRERYIDHPVVGTIGRRLHLVRGRRGGDNDRRRSAGPRRRNGRHRRYSTVSLWHPAGRNVEEVVAWRRRIESLGIVQPFKQAHREVYLLTDAERRTRALFQPVRGAHPPAAPVQCTVRARGWKNKLRLMVDDDYPPASRELPQWGIRAEFWIEGIGDDYGQDTNEAGTYLRLAYGPGPLLPDRRGAEQRPCRAVAATARRAFGPGADEINEPLPHGCKCRRWCFRRSCGTSICSSASGSIGNDPTWQDGGPREPVSANTGGTTRSASCPATAIATRETGPRAARPAAQDCRQVLAERSVSAGAGDSDGLQDPPRLGEHPDGAERPVSLHRAGCEGTCWYAAGVPAF